MCVKGGEIEVDGTALGIRRTSIRPAKGNTMGGTGRRKKPPQKDSTAPAKVPPAPIDDDDVEDGDIATPKRDRNDEDDQPL
jgi:hypothetical protein